MPYRIEFDSSHQILRGQFEGRVTDEELKEFYQVATETVARIQPRGGIMDFSAVTSFEVSPDTIRGLAKLPPAMPDPRAPRVLIAPAPDIFGLARMFQFEGEETRPSLHVVRTSKEAGAILGIQQLNFEPLKTNDRKRQSRRRSS